MKPLTNKTSVNIDVPASSILNDSIPVQEAFPERLEKSNNSNDYSHTPPQYLRNGSIVCSAHDLIVDDYKEIKKELKEINSKLNKLIINDGIDEKKDEKTEKWKERGYGSILTVGCLVIFELIKYLTPL